MEKIMTYIGYMWRSYEPFCIPNSIKLNPYLQEMQNVNACR